MILQQKDVAPGPAKNGEGKAADPSKPASDERKKEAESSVGREMARRRTEPVEAKPAEKPHRVEPPEQAQVFNTARGNRAFVESQTAQLVAPPQPAAPEFAASQLPQSFGGVAGQLATTSPATMRGGAAGAGQAGEQDRKRLAPQGRISLAVEFPTEGRVLHFEKLKANAELELSTVTPKSFARWKVLGWGALLAALLAGLGAWVDHRKRRRRWRTATAI